MKTALVLFGQDLRLEDNPALYEAVKQGYVIVAVYVRDPSLDPPWWIGGASSWWLHQSLCALQEEIRSLGGALILREGPLVDVVTALLQEAGACAVFWNRRVEPSWRKGLTLLQKRLEEQNIEVDASNGSYLVDPSQIFTGQGTYYKVFTRFWETAMKELEPIPLPLPIPKQLSFYQKQLKSACLESWNLVEHTIHWAEKMAPFWTPGSAGAKKRLAQFVGPELDGYALGRDYPGQEHVSKLSPHLHYGEISPRQVWHGVDGKVKESIRKYRAELGWREFSAYLLYHFPELPHTCFREEFSRFPWQENPKGLRAWQRGMTGYPIVDAGMRQLWETGWMHNRVRMVVASFLIKDLHINWREGEKWFWDTLVDADLASNAASWQWVAGSGADAAPYFRIFNPVTQGKDYDPEGVYIKKWVPELAEVPVKYLHAPWEAPEILLRAAGVTLGRDYPYPIVDHAEARKIALSNFDKIK